MGGVERTSPAQLREQFVTALLEASKAAGGQERLAHDLGLTPSTVSKWKAAGRPSEKGARLLDDAGYDTGAGTFLELYERVKDAPASSPSPDGNLTPLARIPLAGRWFQRVLADPLRPYHTLDQVNVTHSGDSLHGQIQRLEPSKETTFRWAFEGREREERFLFLTFWSVSEDNPSSNGVIALKRAGLRLEFFEGLYVRDRFELGAAATLMAIPLTWTRHDPRDR